MLEYRQSDSRRKRERERDETKKRGRKKGNSATP